MSTFKQGDRITFTATGTVTYTDGMVTDVTWDDPSGSGSNSNTFAPEFLATTATVHTRSILDQIKALPVGTVFELSDLKGNFRDDKPPCVKVSDSKVYSHWDRGAIFYPIDATAWPDKPIDHYTLKIIEEDE